MALIKTTKNTYVTSYIEPGTCEFLCKVEAWNKEDAIMQAFDYMKKHNIGRNYPQQYVIAHQESGLINVSESQERRKSNEKNC